MAEKELKDMTLEELQKVRLNGVKLLSKVEKEIALRLTPVASEVEKK